MGIVLGYRIGKRRDLGHLDRGIKGSFIEANMCDQIDLDSRASGIIITWGQGVCLNGRQRCSGGGFLGCVPGPGQGARAHTAM